MSGTLYHCFYREPEGEAILASCFRDVSGEQKNYLFAATHLSKALAFSFSYHDDEVVMNSGIDETDDEIVILAGGQKTIDKPRHIRVFSFSDEGFQIIPRARQAVSEHPMPFSQASLIIDTTDINVLMQEGLQIFVLPHTMDAYIDQEGVPTSILDTWRSGETAGHSMKAIIDIYGARWLNQERNINPSSVLEKHIPQKQEERGSSASLHRGREP